MPSDPYTYTYAYTDPRTGDRVRERVTRSGPNHQIDQMRQQEPRIYRDEKGGQSQALVLQKTNSSSEEDNNIYATRQIVRKQRFADDTNLPPPADHRREVRDRRRSRRRDASLSSSSSERESSREHQRRRRHRRTRSQAPPPNDDGAGKLWYSCKNREDGNFLEKTFDPSYDGLFAAAAGGLIGAMTVRRLHIHKPGFTEEENRASAAKNRWKTVASAAAGAAVFNAAEQWFRVYTEEKIEAKADAKH